MVRSGQAACKDGMRSRPMGMPIVCVCLWLSVVSSSLGVVYSTYETRQLTRHLENLRREATSLQVTSGKYLLEKSTLAAYTRVESEAKNALDMEVPSIESLIMVRR
jgi:cell division protein FtsL